MKKSPRNINNKSTKPKLVNSPKTTINLWKSFINYLRIAIRFFSVKIKASIISIVDKLNFLFAKLKVPSKLKLSITPNEPKGVVPNKEASLEENMATENKELKSSTSVKGNIAGDKLVPSKQNNLLQQIKCFIKSSSFIIQTKQDELNTERRYPFYKVITLGILIFIFNMFFGFFLFSYTPLNGLAIFNGKNNFEHQEIERQNLEEKIIRLNKEFNNIKISNAKLKNILTLQDTIKVVDSLNNQVLKKSGNNIFAVFKNFIDIFANVQIRKFFVSPLNGYISKGFEPNKGHNGIDIVGKSGAPISAASSGYVLYSGFNTDDGYTCIIAHSNGFVSIYKHCSVLLKKQREIVNVNEIIALVGNTGGESSGAHLHFELWKDGNPVNPTDYFIK